MVTRKRNEKPKPPACPVNGAVKVIGGKWKTAILYCLLEGPKRFNELQRLVGNPSARILTVQLRELEKDKIIRRKSYDQIPPKVEYSLTPKGLSVSDILASIAKWGEEHL
jgi:DNA-binding HxlR family transcriptional regulator